MSLAHLVSWVLNNGPLLIFLILVDHLESFFILDHFFAILAESVGPMGKVDLVKVAQENAIEIEDLKKRI